MPLTDPASQVSLPRRFLGAALAQPCGLSSFSPGNSCGVAEPAVNREAACSAASLVPSPNLVPGSTCLRELERAGQCADPARGNSGVRVGREVEVAVPVEEPAAEAVEALAAAAQVG